MRKCWKRTESEYPSLSKPLFITDCTIMAELPTHKQFIAWASRDKLDHKSA